MSEPIRIENESAFRVHDPSLGTIEMGDSKSGIRLELRKSVEFVLRLGEPSEIEPSIEITPDACKVVPGSDGQLTFEHREPDLQITVHSSAGPHSQLRKWLVVKNANSRPLILFDVVLETMLLTDSNELSGGGLGWPVFIEGVGFAGIEFPETENSACGPRMSLMYYPAVTIQPDRSYTTEKALFMLSTDPEDALRMYVAESRLRKSTQLFACYSSRGAHELEGPNERILNEQLDQLIELKSTWRVPFEYFVVDYGYWPEGTDPTESGDFHVDREIRFPGGSFDHILSKLSSAGLKLGMWVGGGCPGRKDFAKHVKESLLNLNTRQGLKLVKIDISDWACAEASHGHPPGKYARYQAAKNMIGVFSALKAADQEVVILAGGFSRSPWWVSYVDFIAGVGEDACELPAPSIRDSQILNTDLDHRFFELDPGTFVGYSDTHFWTGKQCWRKNLLMSLCRSNQLLLSGELHMLDEDDKLFLQRVAHMRKVHTASFAHTRKIFGNPKAGEVYGYADTANGRGLVTIFNPSWEPRAFPLKAEDIGCDPSVRNICVELFPETEVAAIPAGGYYHEHIDPWEVLWLEAGPSDEHCELVEDMPPQAKNCPMLVTPVDPPADIEHSMELPLDRVFYRTGSAFRCRPLVPRSWQGFPLLLKLNGSSGELYVNNHPLNLRGSAEFGLFYPWTPRYGLVKFGKENLFYLANKDPDIKSLGEITLSAASYFSSSACREDWPHATDATAVVLIKYLKDGEPYRHSHDPQMADCAIWLDGIWMEPYRVPPLVPRIWSKYSWAVFMCDLEGDWECVRALVPKLVDCDYEVEFFLTDRLSAAAYARG